MSDTPPPIFAPGFDGENYHSTRQKKRAALIMTSVWVGAATVSSLLVEQLNPSLFQRLGLLSGQLAAFFVLIAVVVLSDRFTNGVIPYGLTAFGLHNRVDSYRYVGGVPMVGRRVITERDYHTCGDCEAALYEGVVEDELSHVAVAGVPLLKRAETRTYYCTDCRDEQWRAPDDEAEYDLINVHRGDEFDDDLLGAHTQHTDDASPEPAAGDATPASAASEQSSSE